jgi:hypothetical protein
MARHRALIFSLLAAFLVLSGSNAGTAVAGRSASLTGAVRAPLVQGARAGHGHDGLTQAPLSPPELAALTGRGGRSGAGRILAVGFAVALLTVVRRRHAFRATRRLAFGDPAGAAPQLRAPPAISSHPISSTY